MKEECQQEVFYMEGDEGKHFCSMHVGQHLSMYEISLVFKGSLERVSK